MDDNPFSGLGDFFNNLFGAFTGGVAQPSDNSDQPHKDADLFGQLFAWLPDGGHAMSNAFAPPKRTEPWEVPTDIQSAQMRSYGGGPVFKGDPGVNIGRRAPAVNNSITSGGMNYPVEDPQRAIDVKGGSALPTDPSNPNAPADTDPKSPTFAAPRTPGSQAYWEASRAPAEDPKEKALSVAQEMRRDRSVHWQPSHVAFSPVINDAIDRNAKAAGVDTRLARRIAQIESGGRPGVVTGSYKGLYQLSNSEFMKFGGGDIFNPEDNARAGLKKIAAERLQLSKALGRDVSPGEVYLAHQQGVGGATKHLQNPDQPAWLSMYQTAEGLHKGVSWAKRAIWGNVPDRLKRIWGSVENITSGDFANLWIRKVEGN